MKIVSKFKDYYDCSLYTGYDESLFFKRENIKCLENPDIFASIKKEIQKVYDSEKSYNFHSLIKSYRRSWQPEQVEFHKFFIVFCGKLYPCCRIEYSKDKNKNGFYNYKTGYVYSFDELIEFLETNNFDYIIGKYDSDIGRVFVNERMKDFFTFQNETFNSFTEKLKVPYMSFSFYNSEQIECEICPKLSTYQFYKKFDSFSAYQEIEMFMSSVLVSEMKIDVIDDKYKILEHGFDKNSFRKLPTKIR